jgi:uncharacterized membrane protein YgdD (TMEM256/DUF423 family)
VTCLDSLLLQLVVACGAWAAAVLHTQLTKDLHKQHRQQQHSNTAQQ